MIVQNFTSEIARALFDLDKRGEKVDPGRWQGVSTEGKPDLVTKELLNVKIEAQIPGTPEMLGVWIQPNLPWAEDHFQERVSRDPSNPGEQYKNWPWWKGQDDVTLTEHAKDVAPGEARKFTHTYQERFWPKDAGERQQGGGPHRGIRYQYGDLDDVVNQLLREPQTRQATFPIFFPEDTGAVHGGRVPCTLHYHFLLRNNRLHLWYPIRSCDAVRHFRDDLYMAGRLCQWVIEQCRDNDPREPESFDHRDYHGHEGWSKWDNVKSGMLYFTAYSFHVHMGDYHLLRP